MPPLSLSHCRHALPNLHYCHLPSSFTSFCMECLCFVRQVGLSNSLRVNTVKVFCPRCKDIYKPSGPAAALDGAYFGPSFPHMLLMCNPKLIPVPRTQRYVPRIYGFKVHSERKSNGELAATDLDAAKGGGGGGGGAAGGGQPANENNGHDDHSRKKRRSDQITPSPAQ